MNIQEWMKSINRAELARQINKTRQYMHKLAYQGMSPYVRKFEKIANYLNINIEDLDPETYTEQLYEKRKKRMQSAMTVALQIDENALTVHRICNNHSNILETYIKIYKLYKNGTN